MADDGTGTPRDVIFISKATPEDDEFVLWLAPRLEAAGYKVFADILSLEPGDRWRKQVTGTLQNSAFKMLLCCRDSTLAKDGVQEEIGIASDQVKDLNDPRFIIPLRLEKFKKLFGIGELQWVNFVGSWASGLSDLLETLATQNVPRAATAINPSWEAYKSRLAIKVEEMPEVLTSNWLRVVSIPDVVSYYQPTGAINHALFENACSASLYPAAIYLRGFFSFSNPEQIASDFAAIGKFSRHSEHNVLKLISEGSANPDIKSREAKNIITAMFREAWEGFCRKKGFYQYAFSQQLAFHVTEEQMPLGKRVSWGRPGRPRNSMLRNSAGGRVWQYGVSATASFWPFPHFRLKSRVLFAALSSGKTGEVFNDSDLQHRLRRSVCKGWRNKAWHGRLMAFLKVAAGDSRHVEIALSPSEAIKLDATPLPVTSPVTTTLPDTMSDDGEEQDETTLANPHSEGDE